MYRRSAQLPDRMKCAYARGMSRLPLSENAEKHLKPIVQRFEPSTGLELVATAVIAIAREELPVPWLAHLALVQVVGCNDIGRGEKTLWQVPFRYDGVEAMLTHEKFGVRLYVGSRGREGDCSKRLGHEIVGKLRAIVRTLERDVLKDLADERLTEGRVTVMNQAVRLRAAYEHFRDEAATMLAASEAQDTKEMGTPGDEGGLFAGVSRHFERLELGSFNAIAAINAYFSWLEHVLVLALAFTDVEPGEGRLMDHIGAKWGDQFRRVFGTQDADARQALARLHEVAETYRNTYAHGGFDKLGATIGIHVDGIGVVPARLTDVRRSPHFELYPFAPASFANVVSVLDGIDEFLRNGPRRLAISFAESGMDVPFDDESREEFRRATATDRTFSEFKERRARMIDDYENMDF
jgi:hypothetical protein